MGPQVTQGFRASTHALWVWVEINKPSSSAASYSYLTLQGVTAGAFFTSKRASTRALWVWVEINKTSSSSASYSYLTLQGVTAWAFSTAKRALSEETQVKKGFRASTRAL